MAKSTRSKVKRAFRAKKRTEGVFAAADAARLQRLHAKLHALTTTAVAREEEKGEGEEDKEQDVDMPGSCWFAALGLLDHQDINPALMQSLGFGASTHSMRPLSSFTHSSPHHRPFPPFDVYWLSLISH